MEISSNTIIEGDFKTSVTPKKRLSRQKVNNETQTLKDTLDQLDLTDIYRAFYTKTTLFFLQVQIEHFAREITFWLTTQALVNLKKIKGNHFKYIFNRIL